MFGYNTIRSFSEIDWNRFQDSVYQSIDNEIQKNSDDYILNVCEEDYISYLVEKHSFVPISVDKDTENVHEPEEFEEELGNYNSYGFSRYGRYRSGYRIKISYSFTGDSELFKVRPSSFFLNSYDIIVDTVNNTVSFEILVYSQDVLEFEREKNSVYNRAFANIDKMENCIEGFNSGLRDIINHKFKIEKEKRKSKNNFFAAIKVRKSSSSPSTYGVPVIQKKKMSKPAVGVNKQYTVEPTLDITTYENIITELRQVGASMERKPSLYLGKDEEGIRDVFVTMLETRFEGVTATGETFNHSGKTDILLKNASDGSNLFIAECKFWHGQKHLKDAINQLFDRYLTWRDSKVALIIFVRGTNFTTALQTIDASIISHEYFIRLNKNRDKTSKNYIFRLPQDKDKEVYLEVMAFNFDKIE